MSDSAIEMYRLQRNERLKLKLLDLKKKMVEDTETKPVPMEIERAEKLADEICAECADMSLGKMARAIDEFEWPNYQEQLRNALSFLSDAERKAACEAFSHAWQTIEDRILYETDCWFFDVADRVATALQEVALDCEKKS